tara:strand:- start:14421 stop:15281 length:861 start_codon:yes stop_codon:yes gene_type:complete
VEDFDDNEDYQEDIEQVKDDEVIDDEQDIDDSQDDEQDNESDDSADDVLEFSFDDDGDSDEKDPFAGQDAPQWVKDNRRRAKEVQRENRDLKRKLEQYESSKNSEQQALREKPTLDAHEYDSDAYEQDYAAWLSEKSQHEAKAQAEQQKYQHYDERYKSSVDAVRAKVADYDEIEQSVVDTIPPQRQALIKMLVDDPARMVVALGKSPAQMEKLAGLDDIQFAKQIVLMEQQMSSTSKSRNQNKPKPKTHELEGAAGGADTRLAKLEAEAAKTGDRSKVIAYKRNK